MRRIETKREFVDACNLRVGDRFEYLEETHKIKEAREELNGSEFNEEYVMRIETETGLEFRFSTYMQLRRIER